MDYVSLDDVFLDYAFLAYVFLDFETKFEPKILTQNLTRILTRG